MRLLVAGWQGQLSRAIVGAALRRADVSACAVGRPAHELVSAPTVHRNLTDVTPDVIINTAAYTRVDDAEDDRDAAFRLNSDGARLLSEAAAARGTPIIHLSTDYVFDGSGSEPLREDDPTQPASVYGQSKRAGELAVMAANPKHLILRTSWVHSADGRNFTTRMLAQARANPVISVVADQFGSPTYAPDLATVILELAARLDTAQREGAPFPFGLYHAAGAGGTSWHGFAEEIFRASAAAGGPKADIQPIPSAAYPTRAPRPAHTILDCSKLNATFGLSLPDWSTGVRRCVAEILAEERDGSTEDL